MKVAVVGLGKLGSPFAALLASRGHDVVGADLDRRVVDAVNRGEAPVSETGLEELIAAVSPRLRATTDAAEATRSAEVVFVVVPTKSLPEGTFDVGAVVAAMRSIGAGVREDPAIRRVVVVTSTVLPGATAGPIRAALEESSGIEVGEALGLCYSPEFIALGSVIRDMRRPDFVLVGESSGWAGAVVGDLLHNMTENRAPVRRMRLEEAELAKIAVNTFVTTKISYANTLAELCERLPGADASVVAAAVGLDSRIGSGYLSPGAPFGGPCFPRDNAAFAAFARSLGCSADIAEATDRVNRRQAARVASEVASLLQPGERVGILGVTYKPGTTVTDESFGLALAEHLAAAGAAALIFDPAAELAPDQLPAGVEVAISLEACVAESAVLVIATAWPQFEEVASLLQAAEPGPRLVYDCWRLLTGAGLPEGVQIRRLGEALAP